ncbi:MAG TPA: hypothetical protein VEQ35_08445 [Beijerinckia sp.]|jgi:hypothetical protein|nr:hypothetical protein [Beijerinckia sp.]
MPIERTRALKERALSEARKFAVIFLYLWVVLSLFALHKSIILEKPTLAVNLGFAFVNALLLGKVMLIGEALQLANSFKGRPLAYPIVYRSAVFAVLLIGFNVLEEAAQGMWEGKTFITSIQSIGGGRLEGIIIVATIIFVGLIPFFAFKEIAQHIGEDKMYELFFVRRTKFAPQQS